MSPGICDKIFAHNHAWKDSLNIQIRALTLRFVLLNITEAAEASRQGTGRAFEHA